MYTSRMQHRTTSWHKSCTSNERAARVTGASLFAPAPPNALYEAPLDVRGFPGWAPGARWAAVLKGAGTPGMMLKWGLRAGSAAQGVERAC